MPRVVRKIYYSPKCELIVITLILETLIVTFVATILAVASFQAALYYFLNKKAAKSIDSEEKSPLIDDLNDLFKGLFASESTQALLMQSTVNGLAAMAEVEENQVAAVEWLQKAVGPIFEQQLKDAANSIKEEVSEVVIESISSSINEIFTQLASQAGEMQQQAAEAAPAGEAQMAGIDPSSLLAGELTQDSLGKMLMLFLVNKMNPNMLSGGGAVSSPGPSTTTW